MKNIIICGFMGAGKTVVGKELCLRRKVVKQPYNIGFIRNCNVKTVEQFKLVFKGGFKRIGRYLFKTIGCVFSANLK